mgnify:CR=1|jgi:hypothetical protein
MKKIKTVQLLIEFQDGTNDMRVVTTAKQFITLFEDMWREGVGQEIKYKVKQ